MDTTQQSSNSSEAHLYDLLRGVSREQVTAMKRIADSCSRREFEEFLHASAGPTQTSADLGCWGPGPTTFNPDAPGPGEPTA